MSERDDWKLSRDVRETDQRLDARFQSDRDLPFIAPEDRESHLRKIKESIGRPAVHGVAMAALVTAGSYIGLRHFPSGVVRRAGTFVSNTLKNLTSRTSGGSLYEGLRSAFSRSGPAARSVMDPNLAKDIDLARNIFSARSGYIGNREAVLSSLLQRYVSSNPYQQPVPGTYPQQIRHLASMPAFRSTATRMGMQPAQIAAQLTQAATHPTTPTVGDLIRSVAAIRLPFTQWKPLELLLPTEMFGQTPALAKIARENIPSPTASSGLFAGGRLFEVQEVRRAGKLMKIISQTPIGEGYTLGRLGSGMGRGAAARMGGDIARPLADILADYPDIETSQTPYGRVRRSLFGLGEKFGIGPQYSPRAPIGGRARNVFDMIRGAATSSGAEFPGVPNQVWGVTPEGAWVKEQLGKIGLSRIGPVGGINDLSFIERAQLRLGMEPTRVVEKAVGGRMVRQRAPVAKLIDEAGRRINPKPQLTKAALRGEFYAFKGINQGLMDWFNYHVNRPMWLLQEMTGLGLKMGKSPADSMWRIGTRVVLPAYLGWEALQYAEYKSRRWFGYGPISGPALAYTKARTEAQKILDSAGITDKAEELEEKFPGMIESPFSKALALGGGTFGGAMLGRHVAAGKGGAIGAALGLTAGLVYATGITKDADALKDIYEGKEDVPVRADRWWTLGRQPFGGSRIKYFKKHWFAEMMSDYKSKAIYGSSKESWRGSWMPVPENWFLLKNIYDPYYVENRHYYDRPYPTTSPLFEEAPLVGPLAGATIGQLIKPTRYRPVNAPSAEGLPYEISQGQADAVALGLPPTAINRPIPRTKWTMRQLTGETVYRLFDWTGLPGFMLGSIKENITGQRGWFEDETVLASSGSITSAERNFYDKNYGGLLGTTEFFRRFIPRKRNVGIYNPIRNVAPEWLPGARSVFPGDRAGYIDFHTGDPFTALEKGEARLPGEGYEALHSLHSGAPGVYDEFDRFSILADVAPYSEAFKHYKSIMDSQVHSKALDDAEIKRYYQIIDNQQQRAESKVSSYNNRFSTGAFASDQVTIDRVLSATKFQVREMPGVTFNLAGINDRPGEMDGTQLDVYKSLSRKMRAMQGAQVRMTWGGPGVETPAIIENLNRRYIEQGLEADRITGLGYQAKYGAGGLPAAWEGLIHAQMPGPLDYPRVKWLGTRSAIEEYDQTQVYGTADTGWSHPFKNYILPWYNSFTHTQTAESIRARQITEHIDNVKWVKNQRMARYADDADNVELAQRYQQRSGQTMVALNANQPNFWTDIYAAMPPAERPYFNVFAGTTSTEEQERIIESVPDYMRHMYIGLWKRKMPTDAKFNSPVLQRYAEMAEQRAKVSPDERVAEFFSQHPMPPKDWMGWHPGVDLEGVVIKTANQEAVDIHQLGYWESQALQSQQLYPDMEPLDIDSEADLDTRDAMLKDLHQNGYTDIETTPSVDDEGTINLKFRRRRAEYSARRESVFSGSRYSGRDW